MSFFNPTEEEKLRSLIFKAKSIDIEKKKKGELLGLIQEFAKQSEYILQHIEEFNEQETINTLEAKIKRKDDALQQSFDIIRQTEAKWHETEAPLAEATNHSENWGGARPGAGRKPTGIKRFSRKVICTSRMAAAFAEYGRQLGKTPLDKILKKQKIEETWDYKIRYIYLSKDEWEVVKPVYKDYRQNSIKST